MSQFNEFVREHFSFLQQYGYTCSEENSESIVSFAGKNNRIDIIFLAIGYELTCQFVDNGKNTFTLQDGLGYVNIKEVKGLYQIASTKEMKSFLIKSTYQMLRFFKEYISIDLICTKNG